MIGNFYPKDGFQYFRKTNNIGDILDDRFVIESSKIEKSIKYVNQNRIRTITINPVVSKVENLEFLKQMQSIEGLYILQDNLDLSPINYLNHLRVLHLNRIDKSLDFANFKNLQVLGATLDKTLNNLNECANLFWLWLDNYKFNNLNRLSTLSKLTHLNLHKTSIENLRGIELLCCLRELNIDTASKLASLEGLSSSNDCLIKMNINNAKNLHDYQPIEHLTKVENIYFYKTGDCENLDFVSNLTSINTFVLGGKYIVKK